VSDVLVLCYHAVSDDWRPALAVPPARFEQQLTMLVERGYTGATFTQAVTAPPAARTLAVTFDDGFRSVLDRARPILDELGLPGTVFVPTDFPDRARLRWDGIEHWLDGPHEHELRPLSWGELGELAEAGWEVGSHTRTHPRLTQLADTKLRDELLGSRLECQRRLGRPCRAVAYPYGDVDRRVVAAAAAAGYETGAGLPVRLHRRRPIEWPRIGIFANDPPRRFATKVSPLWRWVIGVPPAEAVLHFNKHARRRLGRASAAELRG
jgi:peptidoglycan/xylan/chitin deacetylase (PgdA/CDA1 family)